MDAFTCFDDHFYYYILPDWSCKRMNADHFKEIVESVCISTHSTKPQLAKSMSIAASTLWRYETYGVPEQKMALVMARLKEHLFRQI